MTNLNCLAFWGKIAIFLFAFSNSWGFSNKVITFTKDSSDFVSVTNSFSSLMDTSKGYNVKIFSNTFWDYQKQNFSNMSHDEKTKLKEIKNSAISELDFLIEGFKGITIPNSFSPKITQRLEESKEAFVSAYTNLKSAIQSLGFYLDERSGYFIEDYQRYMMIFNEDFSRGSLKYSQAKMRYESTKPSSN